MAAYFNDEAGHIPESSSDETSLNNSSDKFMYE